jgi:hypothetical protein
MGITATRLEQILIGNTLQVIQENICPVMIIPPDTKYHKILNHCFTSDLKRESTTPILNSENS